MERQIKIWGVLAASGVVLASLVYLMTSKHAPVFLSTAAAFFVMMFFVLVGRVASLKNRITELKEDVQMYRTLSQGPLPSYQEPQVEQVIQPAPNHTVSIMPEGSSSKIADTLVETSFKEVCSAGIVGIFTEEPVPRTHLD